MNTIDSYLDNLLLVSKEKLQLALNIKNFDFDDFSLINSYLIYNSLSSNQNKNTLIYFPEKETKTEFYIPAIITLSLEIFFENYANSNSFRITPHTLYNSFFAHIFDIKNKKMPNYFDDKSIIITEKVFENKLKNFSSNLFYLSLKKLEKTVCKDTVNTIFSPIAENIYNNHDDFSNYAKKILGLINFEIYKKDLECSIEKDIHKAFPFCYITKTGKYNYNIPIDPMIYIVNNYETARKYILNKGTRIKNAVFIGANKYKNDFLSISEDLNNRKIENCLFIGSCDIEADVIPNVHKWRWTLSELDYFNYIDNYQINKLLVDSKKFTDYLDEFNLLIKNIEIEYGLNLKELFKYLRYSLHVVIPSAQSRLEKELDDILLHFEKEGQEIVEMVFEEIDEYDYEEIWSNIFENFTKLINYQKGIYLKYQKLKQELKTIDYLVVQKDYIDIWREECSRYEVRNIISFKEYEQLDCSKKIIVFLGFFGYNHLKSILFSPNRIHIILYPEEELFYNNCLNRFKRDTDSELKNPDRKTISKISFKGSDKIEDISELIKRLFKHNEDNNFNADHLIEFSTNLLYEITFENEDSKLELDANKTILLYVNNKERNEKVKNLLTGDRIRIYDNSTKNELYQIALSSDETGKLNEIEKYSQLWKTELLNYSKKFRSLEHLLKHLNYKGLTISNEATLKNWISPKNSIKFPQTHKNLLVIKKTIDSDLINNNFNDIIKSRRAYNGIMIALGRDLSDEISKYIINREKGEILKKFSDMQIHQFVNQNAKERIIKTIRVIDHE